MGSTATDGPQSVPRVAMIRINELIVAWQLQLLRRRAPLRVPLPLTTTTKRTFIRLLPGGVRVQISEFKKQLEISYFIR
jgi:hypothetical protein